MTGTPSDPCPMNEQTAGWVFGVLEPGEEREVLAHLPGCASCQAVARDADDVTGLLATAAIEPADPPPGLRDRIMAQGAVTPQLHDPQRQPSEQGTGPTPTSTAAERPAPRSRPADQRPPRDPRRPARRRRLVAVALATAAALVIGALGARTLYLDRQADEQATAQAQIVTELLQDIGRPGTRYAVLQDAEDNATVGAVVVTDGLREVYTVGLPENATERDTYVLWGLNTGTKPAAIGTFDVTTGGSDVRIVGPTNDPDRYGQYAVSREPGRTAPPAPSAVIASGTVTS